jgi:hypothetical protein
MVLSMHRAYILTKTLWEISQHLTKMGPEGHTPYLPQSNQPALLYT